MPTDSIPLNLISRIIAICISLNIGISLSAEKESDNQWKLRDSASFFWDNRNKEIKETIEKKTETITNLENELVSVKLALSVKEKENEQLQRHIAELNKERELLRRSLLIREQEVNNLKVQVYEAQKNLKQAAVNEVISAPNEETIKTEVISDSQKNKTEEKIAAYFQSVDESYKLPPTPIEEPVKEKPSVQYHKSIIEPREKDVIINELANADQLSFEAYSVNAVGHVNKAYLSEFFLTKSTIKEILDAIDINIKNYEGEHNPYSFWAQASLDRKSFDGASRNIRTELLTSSVARVRTDFNGFGSFNDVEPGKYYLLAVAQIGKVGTVWEMPVEISNKPQKIRLTRDNSVWYK
jgi:hypothetical protein